ncbi:hypothetical protein F4801DRAFT_121303 [Xylaria longipes]|nr:hypothetical protein F4801DRAFT_121303 [Xylaria longipes]
MKERPNVSSHFMWWMVRQREGLPIFPDVVDFKEEFASQGVNKNTPVFVDIGAGLSHQCVALQ